MLGRRFTSNRIQLSATHIARVAGLGWAAGGSWWGALLLLCAPPICATYARAHNSTRHVWGDTAPPRPVLLFCMFILRSRKRELLRLIFAFSHIIAHMHACARALMPVGWRDRAGAAAVAAAPAPRRREHARAYRRYANAHASANANQYIYSIYIFYTRFGVALGQFYRAALCDAPQPNKAGAMPTTLLQWRSCSCGPDASHRYAACARAALRCTSLPLHIYLIY